MSQLEKSRDAVSVANLRAAYAEAASEYLASDMEENTVIKTVKFEGTTSESPIFSGLGTELPFTLDSTTFATEPSKGDHTITFRWNSDNTVTATVTDSTTGS